MPQVPSPAKTAVLLIAHGSRRAEANDDLRKLARLVRNRQQHDLVEIAFLELAEPTIPQGAAACIAAGAGKVLMLPYFLSAGRHVVDDLQGYRRQFREEFPEAEFVLCPPLGLHEKMIDIVFDRLTESIDTPGTPSDESQ